MIELKNRIAEGQFYFLLTFILVSDMVNYISNELSNRGGGSL